MAFSEEYAGTVYIVPDVSKGEGQMGRVGHYQRAIHGGDGVQRIVRGNLGSEATGGRGYEGVDLHSREIVETVDGDGLLESDDMASEHVRLGATANADGSLVRCRKRLGEELAQLRLGLDLQRLRLDVNGGGALLLHTLLREVEREDGVVGLGVGVEELQWEGVQGDGKLLGVCELCTEAKAYLCGRDGLYATREEGEVSAVDGVLDELPNDQGKACLLHY